jgi:putative RecB family exonuclease
MIDPVLPGGAFSHSQYEAFKACGRAYEFKYVKNLRTPPSPAMARGTAIHAGVETALIAKKEGRESSLDAMLALVSDSFDKAKEDITEWGDEDPGKLKDTAVSLYRVFHAAALPKMNPIEIEEPFVVKVGSVTVRGIIDLVDHEKENPGDPGKIVVADLKTSAAKWSQNEVDKDTQLSLYTAVKGQINARIDNLVSTKTPAYHRLSTVRGPADHRNLTEDYEQTVDLIKKGVFPMTSMDSWKCTPKWCPYWGNCRGR